jgi:hypothetical protein
LLADGIWNHWPGGRVLPAAYSWGGVLLFFCQSRNFYKQVLIPSKAARGIFVH